MYLAIFLALMVLSLIVQMMLESRFAKYSKVGINMSGAEVAAKMLSDNGVDVQIQSVKGKLTDHYNPVDKTINLSENVFSQRNIAAAAVAAHETGHCLQHASGYLPLKMRSALVPVVTFSNAIVMWVLLIGVLTIEIFPHLIWVGIALFAMTTLFSFITLPVEIDASRRAIASCCCTTKRAKPAICAMFIRRPLGAAATSSKAMRRSFQPGCRLNFVLKRSL